MATKAKTTATNGRPVESAGEAAIIIPRPDIRTIQVPIVGTTPLITHAWGEKAKRMMLEKQMKKAKGGKEAKDPHADYLASLYTADDGWNGFPASAFKAAMVGACRAVDGLAMTTAKRMAFVLADGRSTAQNVDLVRIQGDHRMREDMVRLESGVADIRFRAEFPEWSAVLTVEFNAGIVSAEQLVNLLSLAGYSEGVGEWRPSAPKSSTGVYGRWEVSRS